MTRLREGRDFYYDSDGRMVLTAEFLAARGHCCGSGCRHCPYPPRTDTPSANPNDTRDETIDPNWVAMSATHPHRNAFAEQERSHGLTSSSSPLLDKVA